MKNKVLKPTRIFSVFSDITPDLLAENGIKGVLTDLDDTLVAHNFPLPNEEVREWLKNLKKNNIPVCIISNNRKKRLIKFINGLEIGYFYNSLKPSAHTLESALAVMNIKKEEAVFIGDQFFTDVKAAYNAGVKSFLVTPIGEKSTLFIKFKRIIERKIIK